MAQAEMDLETHLLETLRCRGDDRGLTHGELREKCGSAWRRELAQRAGRGDDEAPLAAVKDFVHRLWQAGRVVIEPPSGDGKSVRVWHPERVGPANLPGTHPAQSPNPAAAGLDQVQAAYARLSRQSRSPYVFLSRLRDEIGVPIEEFHAFLRREQAAGRAVLSIGDWSAASEEERSAVLQAEGRSFIKVRLVGEFHGDSHGTED